MTDGSMDDLPRTLRRERELRERTARDQQLKDQARAAQLDSSVWDDRAQSGAGGYGRGEASNAYNSPGGLTHSDEVDAIVRRVQVPFFSLMGFFIKAVFAAVPALLILIGLLYGFGILLETYFPWLIKMKIVISFP